MKEGRARRMDGRRKGGRVGERDRWMEEGR